MKFIYQNCETCRLHCAERVKSNKDQLLLSYDTKKYRGQCKPEEGSTK